MSAKRLEIVCLFTLLVVIALRPLISETYDSAGIGFGQPTTEVSEPSPARTAGIDLVVLLAAAGITLVRVRSGEPYRWTGLELGTAVIAVAAMISSAYAGNKRLAINGATDWLCLPILTILLVQLLRRPWQVRLLLCIVLASAAVQAYSCFEQVFLSFPETREEYAKNREQIWTAQNVELDSPQVRLFEARLNSAEATGYLTHSNVAGGYLVLAAFAAGAWAWQRFRAGRPRAFVVIPTIITAVLLAAATLTKSKGAIIAALAGVMLCMIRWKWASWIDAHPARARRLGWGFVAGGMAALVGHGLYHGSLPGSSLNFRWQYWTASARMVADHPITGVGSENFGRRYLQYKDVEAVEDVARPHNFLAAAAAEWGVPGLIGIILLAVGATATGTRHRRTFPSAAQFIDDQREEHSSLILWAVALTGATFAVRLLLLNSTNEAYLFLETIIPAFVFLVAFILIGVESSARITLTPGPITALAVGINIALFVFLLQDGINFALHVPGAATTFIALLAVPIAIRTPVTRSSDLEPLMINKRRRHAKLLLTAVSVAILAHCLLTVKPTLAVARAKRFVESIFTGRGADRFQPPPTRNPVEIAEKSDPFDPTPWELDWMMATAESYPVGETPDRWVPLIDAAIARDPYSTRLWRQKLYWHASRDDSDDRATAIDAARVLTRLHPTSPESWITLGDRIVADIRAGFRTSELEELCNQAVAAYERALAVDDAKPEWEQFRRLTESQRTSIQTKISNLKSQNSNLRSQTSNPNSEI